MRYLVESQEEMKEIDAVIKKYGIDNKKVETVQKIPISGTIEFRNYRSFEKDRKYIFNYDWKLVSIWTVYKKVDEMDTLEIYVQFKDFIIVIPGSERSFQIILYEEEENV